MSSIHKISTREARFPVGSGHGSDAIHQAPIYSYAVTLPQDEQGRVGRGLAFTLAGKETIGAACAAVIVKGVVAAVATAVEAGGKAVGQLGKLIAAHVVARLPHELVAPRPR